MSDKNNKQGHIFLPYILTTTNMAMFDSEISASVISSRYSICATWDEIETERIRKEERKNRKTLIEQILDTYD